MQWLGLILLGFMVWSPACSTTGESACLHELLPEDCTPLYQPTFEKVFTQTLQAGCAVGENSCHTSAGAKGGLIFEDIDASYAALTDPERDDVLVLPGDPGCSALMIILEKDDPQDVMPPGNPLSDGERCAIMKWILNGAPR
jgi:hypothetical protein